MHLTGSPRMAQHFIASNAHLRRGKSFSPAASLKAFETIKSTTEISPDGCLLAKKLVENLAIGNTRRRATQGTSADPRAAGRGGQTKGDGRCIRPAHGDSDAV